MNALRKKFILLGTMYMRLISLEEESRPHLQATGAEGDMPRSRSYTLVFPDSSIETEAGGGCKAPTGAAGS